MTLTGTVLGISVLLNKTFFGIESFKTLSNENSFLISVFFSPKEIPELTGAEEISFKAFPKEKLLEVTDGSDKFFLISVGVNVVAEADEKIDGLDDSVPCPPNDKLKPLLTGVEIGFCSGVLIGVIVMPDGRPAKTELPDPVPAKENDLVSTFVEGSIGFCCGELWFELTLKFCAENGEFVENGLFVAFSLFSIFWRTFSFNFSLTISSVFGFSISFGAASVKDDFIFPNENDFDGSAEPEDNGFDCENPKLIGGGFVVGFGCWTKSGVLTIGAGAGLNWKDFVGCSGFAMLKLLLVEAIGAEIDRNLDWIINKFESVKFCLNLNFKEIKFV